MDPTTTSLPNIENRLEPTINSTKPSDPLHPYYYTSFQEQCTAVKTDPAKSTPNKDRLPIPQKFKDEAERILEQINSVLIQDLTDVAQWTSVIPDLLFEKYDNIPLQRYFIDRAMAKTMNDARIINWLPSFQPLYPIRTLGNGNCLIHAVLIAMVGIHDLNLYLRDRLAQFIDENKALLKIHWQMERLKSDKIYGISSEESKLDDEWNELCDLVHYERSADGQTATNFQFLEAVHVFAISNMLRRPIIVLSEDIIRNKNGEAISVNDLFGIYLPTLSQPNECIKDPIILAYDRSHFCPLQTSNMSTDRTSDNLLPLYLSNEHAYDQKLLPIRFLGDNGSVEYSSGLLRDYLRTQKVNRSLNSTSTPLSMLCAELGGKHLDMHKTFFSFYYKYLKNFFEFQKPRALEERKIEEQRVSDDYVSRYDVYTTNGGSTARRSQFPSSLSPLPSSRSTNGLTNTTSHNDADQSYSYNGAYTPNNGAVYLNNHTSVPQSSERLRTFTRISRPIIRNDQAMQYGRNDSDNIINGIDYSKVTNPPYIDTGNDPYNQRERQPLPQRNAVPIPVHVLPSRTSSNNQSSLPGYQQTVVSNECLLCHRLFNDYSWATFCPKCESSIQNRSPLYDTPSQTNSRSRSTNIHLPSYDSTTRSPISAARPRYQFTCPHCKNPNMNSTSSAFDFYCSVCKKLIPSSYRYH